MTRTCVLIDDREGARMTTLTKGGQTVPINDIEMYYEVHGRGEPLVLLHGFSGAGGKTLLHMATGQPQRVETMVLASAAPYFPEQARAIMRRMTLESHTDEEWQLMRQWHHHGDEQIRALWEQGHGFKDSYDDVNF